MELFSASLAGIDERVLKVNSYHEKLRIYYVGNAILNKKDVTIQGYMGYIIYEERDGIKAI